MSTTKSIIRPWWGDRDRNDSLKNNRRGMETTLRLVLEDPYKMSFVVYVFGKDNYDFLNSEGVKDLVLVDNDPLPRKQFKRNYIHRLDLCRAALSDFDEIVCMNWNCRLVKPFPLDFWHKIKLKESLQAPLIKTKIRILTSRNHYNNRIFPNDGFIYIGEEKWVDDLLGVLEWDNVPNKWTIESLMAHYLDRKHRKWIGLDKYRELYEPECVFMNRIGMFNKTNACFMIHRLFKSRPIEDIVRVDKGKTLL